MFTDLISAPSPTAASAAPDDRARFMRLLATALASGKLVRLTLGQYRGGEAGLERLLVRPITLRDEACVQMVWRHTTKDITKNHPHAQALELLDSLIGSAFGHAHMDTDTQEVQLGVRIKGGQPRYRLQVGKRAAPATAAGDAAETRPTQGHNRDKQRPLALDRPCWVDLGVATTQGALVPSMARKWKQINKFTEIFGAALAASPLADAPTVRVVDFGCGKAYLTFAMHELLRGLGKQAQVTGVELREDLVTLCNRVARQHGHDGLVFDAGDVRSHAVQPMDVMVALHACDIATDHAIHLGLQAGASIIMCSPCCHKQLRPQIKTPAMLRPMLQHGVHLGQEAEMVTDSLRALLLDAAGYDTQVFEFVSLEHTNKNKMILAVRRAKDRPGHAEAIHAQIAEIKAFYGIREQCLETLLNRC
jgi:SAM-dependent methyltransferase